MVRFHGAVNPPHYQHLMDQGLALYNQHASADAPASWIVDVRQLDTLPNTVRHWTATDWQPRAYAAGLRHLRFVEPEHSTRQLAMQLHTATQEAAIEERCQLTQHETLSAAIQQAQQATAVYTAADYQ
ncbi:hypothetical protein BXP70_21895 [Hymenobacter crusticola]|uniref:Uncharacterized protein n=2 Tax=Hymenobacter crusticola TaxID=1770526 RepID=A0A243W8B5_9BACT|nr:hypothetical protein BXP70_21895 [Hymenobacter crusticola]